MKKLLSVLIITAMLISLVPFAFAAETATAPALTLGQAQKATLSRENIEQSFVFVPDETAEYAFSSYATDDYTDTVASIYDADGNLVCSDDDSGIGVNFGIVAELEKDEPYTLVVHSYDVAAKGEAYVTVSKAYGAATEIVASEPEIIMTVGEERTIYVDFLPFSSIEEEVVFTSSNTAVADFITDYSDNIIAKGEGSAKITATSENGLTATVDVTVIDSTPIALNTPVSATLDEKSPVGYYSLTPAQDGFYTFAATFNTSGEIVLYDENGHIAGADGSFCELSQWLQAGEKYSIYLYGYTLVCDYTVEVFPTPAATEMFISGDATQTIDFSQNLYIEVNGILDGEIVWSIDDDEGIATFMPDGESAYLSFNDAGTVKVTATCGDLSADITVTGVALPEVTLDDTYTETVTGLGSLIAKFVAPQAGYYSFTATDNLTEVESGINLHVNNTYLNDSGVLYLGEGETAIIRVERYQNAYYDDDYGFAGDITVGVAAAKDATGIEIDLEDGAELYTDTYYQIEAFAKNADEGGFLNGVTEWSIEGPDADVWMEADNSASVEIYEEGEYTLTVSCGEFTDSVTFNAILPEEIEFGVEKEITVNGVASLIFKPEKSGYYTVCVESDNFVEIYNDYYMYSGHEFKRAMPFLTDEVNIINLITEGTANVKIKIINTTFPTTVKTFEPVVTLNVGDSYSPWIMFTPSEFQENIASMVSSDTSVASVSYDFFEVYAVSEGTATIEITTEYGLKTEFIVNVVGDDYDWAYDIVLDKEELSLTAGQSQTLVATVDAESEKTVTWYSEDESIARVDDKGRVTGIAEGTTYIVALVDGLAAFCEVTVSAPEIVDSSKVFKDVKAGQWYSNAIDYCYSYGFISGTATDTFERDTAVTRGMFITILARIAGVDTGKTANKTTTKFTDVKSGKYYTAAIKWASENGIVSGTSNTTFSPEASISRQDLCVMVTNFAKYMNIELKPSVDEVKFTDESSIKKYAKNSVKACQMAGLVKGYKDGSFGPTKTATRAEAAQILYVFHSTFIAK